MSKNALELIDLKKTYANGVQAVKGISLEVKEGDFFGLLGPNGAGKSTTIGIINGLVKKSEGEVKVFGRDLHKHESEAKMSLGIVSQEINLAMFDKVLETVINQAGYYGIPKKVAEPRAQKVLTQLGLWGKKDHLIRSLSGGMKRRLMIAKALMNNPKLLILDEPTAGVDTELRSSTWEFLKGLNKSGITIILTTHYLEEAEYLCKHIAIIHQGELLANTSTKKLVTMVNKETFILELEKPLKVFSEKKYETSLTDETTLEVTIDKEQDLNDFFKILDKKKIKVLSLRNKQNRLEKFFLEVVEGSKK